MAEIPFKRLKIHKAVNANFTLYTICFSPSIASLYISSEITSKNYYIVHFTTDSLHLMIHSCQKRRSTLLSSIHSKRRTSGRGVRIPTFLLNYWRHHQLCFFSLTLRLFADDYSISLQSANPHRAARLPQLTLNNISTWGSGRGFRFFSSKTGQKHRHSLIPLPELLLQGFWINILDSRTYF